MAREFNRRRASYKDRVAVNSKTIFDEGVLPDYNPQDKSFELPEVVRNLESQTPKFHAKNGESPVQEEVDLGVSGFDRDNHSPLLDDGIPNIPDVVDAVITQEPERVIKKGGILSNFDDENYVDQKSSGPPPLPNLNSFMNGDGIIMPKSPEDVMSVISALKGTTFQDLLSIRGRDGKNQTVSDELIRNQVDQQVRKSLSRSNVVKSLRDPVAGISVGSREVPNRKNFSFMKKALFVVSPMFWTPTKYGAIGVVATCGLAAAKSIYYSGGLDNFQGDLGGFLLGGAGIVAGSLVGIVRTFNRLSKPTESLYRSEMAKYNKLLEKDEKKILKRLKSGKRAEVKKEQNFVPDMSKCSTTRYTR